MAPFGQTPARLQICRSSTCSCKTQLYTSLPMLFASNLLLCIQGTAGTSIGKKPVLWCSSCTLVQPEAELKQPNIHHGAATNSKGLLTCQPCLHQIGSPQHGRGTPGSDPSDADGAVPNRNDVGILSQAREPNTLSGCRPHALTLKLIARTVQC